MPNAGLIEIAKPTKEEKDFCRRIQTHFKRSAQALLFAFALSMAVLVGGEHVSEYVDVDAQSILFKLWPFNNVYLRQFGASPYCASDIRWFYTVVSVSNLIWLIFLGSKLLFELFRRDVSFPRGETPFLYQMIVRVTAVSAAMIGLAYFDNSAGFEMLRSTFLNPSFKQPIMLGAIKIVLLMSFLYFAAALFLEFSGLGLRYLLAKTFGFFLTSPAAAEDLSSTQPRDQTAASEAAGSHFQ
jgi:hypothetical protein